MPLNWFKSTAVTEKQLIAAAQEVLATDSRPLITEQRLNPTWDWEAISPSPPAPPIGTEYRYEPYVPVPEWPLWTSTGYQPQDTYQTYTSLSDYTQTPKPTGDDMPTSTPKILETDKSFNELLQKSLMEAFDEGAESPCDFKESVVASLMKKIGEAERFLKANLTKQLTKDNTKPTDIAANLSGFIPNLIKDCLRATPRAFLAGGSIVKMLTCPIHGMHSGWDDARNDWDIFVHTDDVSKLPVMVEPLIERMMVKSLKENGLYNNAGIAPDIVPIEKLYLGKIPGTGLVNIIIGRYEKIEDVLDSFDFRFLQTGCRWSAATSKLEYIILNDQAWSDLTHNIIHIQPKINPYHFTSQKLDGLRSRIQKYCARGFRDCTNYIEEGFLNRICAKISQVEEPNNTVSHEVKKAPLKKKSSKTKHSGLSESVTYYDRYVASSAAQHHEQ